MTDTLEQRCQEQLGHDVQGRPRCEGQIALKDLLAFVRDERAGALEEVADDTAVAGAMLCHEIRSWLRARAAEERETK